MSEQLKTMLREAADDHPDLALHDDPWWHGRRIRLRRRLAGVAGATVTAAAVVAGVALLTTPDPSSAPEPAEGESVEPALPDQLFDVPANIPDIADDPLHEPVAVVYQARVRTGVFDESRVPVVVGAETGRVRSVRDAGEFGRAIASPDGTMLAMAPRFGGAEPMSSELVVRDVVGDRTVRYELPDEGLGTGVSDVVWKPDGTELRLTAEVTTEISRSGGDGASTARLVPGSLDLQTGQWEEHDDWTRAISPDGRRVIGPGYSAGYVIEASGAEPVSLALGDAGDDTAAHQEGLAFSPDGGRIAALAPESTASGSSHAYSVEAYDANTGERVERVELGDYQDAQLIGWGERGVVVQTTSETGVWVGRVGVTDTAPTTSTLFTLAADTYQGEIDIPADMLDADTRDAEPPETPFDWLAWIPDPFVLVILGVAGFAVALDVFIRRVRSRGGSVTAPGSTDH